MAVSINWPATKRGAAEDGELTQSFDTRVTGTTCTLIGTIKQLRRVFFDGRLVGSSNYSYNSGNTTVTITASIVGVRVIDVLYV